MSLGSCAGRWTIKITFQAEQYITYCFLFNYCLGQKGPEHPVQHIQHCRCINRASYTGRCDTKPHSEQVSSTEEFLHTLNQKQCSRLVLCRVVWLLMDHRLMPGGRLKFIMSRMREVGCDPGCPSLCPGERSLDPVRMDDGGVDVPQHLYRKVKLLHLLQEEQNLF